MQGLEKILEEIDELRGKAGSECTSEDHYVKRAWEYCLDQVIEIIHKHMENGGWIPVEKELPPGKEAKSVIAEETEIEERKAAEVTAGEIAYRYLEIGKGIQELKLPKGDLYVICNVLYDYVDLLRVASESQELEIGKELYKLHADRCEKIRHKIEHKLGYCVEKTIKKCKKKKDESGDVGEDALVLAARKRKESSQEPQKTEEKAARKTEIDGQMSFF